ncbi:hypothetical protein M422DRAFT_251401 [Sphaerobolus stellatus SS14]|uniref:Unplaced genomic scaffold SPHSTscaffold_38, whole genome shotgun sequence n=1 Tax=Sphaerobolus stellatus (strain SS14) TaxID=990650 RepID=A0A0C9VRZ4_SPHS4|nr:hypothetical protein M422DRAFT_251401 [Sphaerobolus stellatus SS14]
MSTVSSTLAHPSSFLPWWKSSSKPRSSPQYSLPSIAHFDRPQAMQWREPEVAQPELKSYESSPLAGPSTPQSPSPVTPEQQMHPLDPTPTSSQWFWMGPHSTSQATAEKTCEMICYFWFSSTLGAPNTSPFRRLRKQSKVTYSPPDGLTSSATAALQFQPTTAFVQFMQKLLQTTQVSQSVIVLSLHYIYRLKEENHFTSGQAGSEFRVAVVALMLANKFVDDNTYTNKTWSDVSGIDLEEINRMEREFLRGVDYRLYVNTETYRAWVNLLKGLVAVKERDLQQWRYSRRYNNVHAPAPRLSVPNLSARARSVSPLPSLKAGYPFTFVAPAFNNPFAEADKALLPPQRSQVPAGPGVKRSAVDAFSPPSAALAGPPSKRPISLDMSVVRPIRDAPASAGSSYPLSAFAKLSINKPDTPSRPKTQPKSAGETAQTLAAPYSIHDRMTTPDPENLYYYVLASSPAEAEGDNRARKAVLRSHQPTYYYTSSVYVPPPPPMYIQSARASPVQPLPSFRYFNSHYSHFDSQYPTPNSNPQVPLSLPPIRVHPSDGDLSQDHRQRNYSGSQTHSRVPVAPFANAGPPGVQWAPHPTPESHAYARYAFPPVA